MRGERRRGFALGEGCVRSGAGYGGPGGDEGSDVAVVGLVGLLVFVTGGGEDERFVKSSASISGLANFVLRRRGEVRRACCCGIGRFVLELGA